MKRYMYLLAVMLLLLGTGAGATNVVSISTTEGAPRGEVTVSISLDNTDMVSSLQVNIPVDDNLSVVENSGLPGSRCADHTVAVSKVDGQLQVYVYSLSMATISGTSGIVATFKLKLGDRPGWYELIPSKVVLADAGGMPLDCSMSGTYQEIRGPYLLFWGMENAEDMDFGGVPTNEKTIHGFSFLNVGNAELVVTGLMFSDVKTFTDESQLDYPYTVQPGEWGYINIGCLPTSKTPINQTVTVLCNSVSTKNILRLKAQPYVVNVLTVEPASGASDDEVTISLTMKNEDAVSGYQVEFDMPKSLQFVEGSFALSDRKKDHTSMVSFADNKLTIIAYSPTDSPFSGNNGEIGSFKVKLNGRESTELKPTNVILSATINNKTENVCSDWHGGYISIICPYIEGEEKLDFGNRPVTEECIASYRLYNTGPMPLVISRIVFDNEYLSVDEPMPLTIGPWQENYITVRYNSLEEVPFNAVMQIHSNDPEMRLKEVKVTGERFAPNYFNIMMPDIAVNHEANLLISLDNYDPISGIQFDIEYPQDYFVPYDDNYTLSPLLQNMTMSVSRVGSNTIRYMFYSIADDPIVRGSNPLMRIAFKPTHALDEGNYDFVFKNITLGTANMTNKYAGSDFTHSMRVWNTLPADANGDSQVNVADAVEIVNYILEMPSERFVFAAADLDRNGEVDVFDLTAAINVVFENKLQLALNVEDNSNANESVLLTSTDGELLFHVDDADHFTSFQFDVEVPQGRQLHNVAWNHENSHSLQFAQIDENRYRVLALSMENAPLSVADNALLKLQFSGSGNGDIVVNHVLFVTPQGEDVYFNGNSYNTVTGVKSVTKSSKPRSADYYDLSGRRVPNNRPTAKGIYIVNGTKYVVK